METSILRKEQCLDCGTRVAWVGIWANVLLVFLKFFVGITSGSRACIADALHSASNIVTAIAILVSRRITRKNVNHEFHFGFGKVEFLAAGFISLLIIVGASILILVSIRHLLHATGKPPHFSAILMAIISVALNEMLFRYMRCAGTHLNSQTILASAWSNRADSFSSMAVIVGVAGAKLGVPHLDPIAALVVVAVIIKISYDILSESVKSLMDVSVNDQYGEYIKDIVWDIDGIWHIDNIKTRLIGHHIWAEIDIFIDPKHSLGNGQHIGDMVKKALHERIHDLEKVTVHIRPASTE